MNHNPDEDAALERADRLISEGVIGDRGLIASMILEAVQRERGRGGERRGAVTAEAKQECSDLIRQIAESPQLIRLHAGELTAGEMRAVRAVLRFVAFRINERP